MGDTIEANTKVLGVVAQQMPIQKNHYMHKMELFPQVHTHIFSNAFQYYEVHSEMTIYI